MPTEPEDGPESQAERRRVLRDDARLREQASTMHAHAVAEANESAGRFGAIGKSTVTGAAAVPQYPRGPDWSAAEALIPPEPPLGYDINEMTPLEPAAVASSPSDVAQAPDDPAAAPSVPGVERAGSSPSSSDDGGFDDAA